MNSQLDYIKGKATEAWNKAKEHFIEIEKIRKETENLSAEEITERTIKYETRPRTYIIHVPIFALPSNALDEYKAKKITHIGGHKIIEYKAGHCMDYPKGFGFDVEVKLYQNS